VVCTLMVTSGQSCPPGSVVGGFTFANQIVCVADADSVPANQSCAPDEFVTGIDAAGLLICTPVFVP
jgi:hypothetical protein